MPSKRVSKKSWRPEVIVAIISLVGVVFAAVVANIDKWIPKKPDTSSLNELVNVLNLRASRILEDMESTKQEAIEAIRSGKGEISEAEFLREHDAIRKTFIELNDKNLEAIKSGQLIASHEMILDINSLLHIRSNELLPKAYYKNQAANALDFTKGHKSKRDPQKRISEEDNKYYKVVPNNRKEPIDSYLGPRPDDLAARIPGLIVEIWDGSMEIDQTRIDRLRDQLKRGL